MLGGAHLGGGEIVAIELAEMLRRHNRQVSIWVPDRGMAHDEACSRKLDVRIVSYRDSISKQRLKSLIALLRVEIARHTMPRSVFHIHEPHIFGGLSPVLSGRSKSIVHIQVEYPSETFKWCFKRPPNIVLTCAQFLEQKVRHALSDIGNVQTRVEVVSNAVDTTRFFPGCKRQARATLNADDQSKVILMLANLAPHKGQETALRCTKQLLNDGHRMECWFAGIERESSGYRDKLQHLAAMLEISSVVKFLGFRTDTDVLLNASDFVLLPSTNEGLPFTILEAQASKRIVLAAPTAGIPEVIKDAETGYLIAADDHSSYAYRIAQLINQPVLYDEITSRAYEQIQRCHTWTSYADRVIGIYESLR